MITIGILALQGNFAQHRSLLRSLHLYAGANQSKKGTIINTPLKIHIQYVRSYKDVLPCHGLIIPGGESTTMRNLLGKAELFSVLRAAGKNGFPFFGVCAGAILLATRILGTDEQGLGLLNIEVERNGYGRQVHSFEAVVPLIPSAATASRKMALRVADAGRVGTEDAVVYTKERSHTGGTVVSGTFIRAPIIRACADTVEVLARHSETPVVVRDGSVLGATFHPEVKGDATLHQIFVTECVNHNLVCDDYLSEIAIPPSTNT